MDDFKIKKFSVSKNKRNRLTLHRRLEIFTTKRPSLTQYLLAIKWIGNNGSHVGRIEKVDLIDAFQLLEYSLEKIYDDKDKKLLKLSKAITKSKGIRVKSRKPTF